MFIRVSLILTVFMVAMARMSASTPICGDTEVGVDRMYSFVQHHNPDFSREIAEAYYEVGCRYGVRGDVALCQAILETGWFRFDRGTAVSPEQHNYCGLGVVAKRHQGHSFSTIEEGVTAHIQHLYAYSTKHGLPEGETVVDPRFGYVKRGSAKTWEGLNGKWAANKHYSDRILKLYLQLSGRVIEVIEVDVPDEFFDDLYY